MLEWLQLGALVAGSRNECGVIVGVRPVHRARERSKLRVELLWADCDRSWAKAWTLRLGTAKEEAAFPKHLRVLGAARGGEACAGWDRTLPVACIGSHGVTV